MSGRVYPSWMSNEGELTKNRGIEGAETIFSAAAWMMNPFDEQQRERKKKKKKKTLNRNRQIQKQQSTESANKQKTKEKNYI